MALNEARTYRLAGGKLELDLTANEKRNIEKKFDNSKVPKGFPTFKVNAPAKWTFKVSLNGDELTLDPDNVDLFMIGEVPGGGMFQQKYRRAGANPPPGKDIATKDNPFKDNPLKDLVKDNPFKDNPFKDVFGKNPPPKDPPKDDPQLPANIVGLWEGNLLGLGYRKIEFTAAGKFIQHSEGKTRNYQVVGADVEIDMADEERNTLLDLKKTFKNLKIPPKWSYKATASATQLTLNFNGDLVLGNPAPGGPLKQTYKRIQGSVPTDPPNKDQPKKDPPKTASIVGKWEATNNLGQKRTIEFTADKFIEYGQNNQTLSRSYQIKPGDKLDIDLPDMERDQLQKVLDTLKRPKGTPRYIAPRHYHFQFTVNGDELMMEPVNNSQPVAFVGAVPGGTVAIRYKRVP
jgi:hypothetical protein